MAIFKVKIPDMMCEHCEKRIRTAVTEAGGDTKSLDLSSKEVVIEINATADKLLALLDDAGYDAQIID
ncbi:MAG: heavy-metal-associated domain-containing protein [Synergistes sp.]|nr:heavy-metal-associated domain-containing protein [Synergistes sp.]